MFKRAQSSLGLKFGLVVGLYLFFFSAIVSIGLFYYLRSQAIRDATDKTEIIMTQTRSLGDYVRDTLRPTMAELLRRNKSQEDFIIEAMSTTHVTHEVMHRFNVELPEYSFKRSSPLPLNPRNRSDALHERMRLFFEEHREMTSWRGIESMGGKDILIFARPVISDESCLWCHGSEKNVPRSLRDRFGKQAKYGWLPNAVVGVESVSIPLDMAFAKARRIATDTFLFGFLLMGILFLALILTFRRLVSKPLDTLSARFRKIASGQEPLTGNLRQERNDEIGELNNSFNVLAQHLLEAEEKLRRTAELEKQLMHTEKLAALGQLSAGVAHEINNPLAGIKLCFNNLLSTEMDAKTREEHVMVVNDGLDRIQTIVRQLLDYAKNAPLAVQPVSLNEIVEKVLQLADYTLKTRGIALQTQLDENLPPITIDANKMEQVLLNLIINAVQAIDGNGTIRVRTYQDGSVCVVAITDSGCGITPDIIDRIFDPFFTTKEVGEGTGLGLTVSKAIVEQHGGVLSVESSAEGTTFFVKIPEVS
jgi:signal transduction histidine kinase